MKKGAWIGIIIAIVITALIIFFLFWVGIIPSGPINYVNQNIPSNFLYQTKGEVIPEEFLIQGNGDDLKIIYFSDDGRYIPLCKNSNEESEVIRYYSHSPGRGYIGGWYYREALICGDQYLIRDASDSGGMSSGWYGPFDV